MSFKVTRIVLLLAVAQPVNSSQFLKQGIRAAAIVSTAGVLGTTSAVAYQNHQHKELYYKNLAAKVNKFVPDLAPVSREFLVEQRNYFALKYNKKLLEEEQNGLLKKFSTVVEWYTRYFFFRNGIPIRGDSVMMRKTGNRLNAAIHATRVENQFAADNYLLTVNENLHHAVEKALDPFYRVRNKSIGIVLEDSHSYYTIEVAMPLNLLLELYRSTLLHEGKHVLDQVYEHVMVGKDITVKDNEINADNNIQGQNFLSAAILNYTITKLVRIYLEMQDVTFIENDLRYRVDRKEEQIFLDNYSGLYPFCVRKKAGEKYCADDFHPCEDERIARFKKRWEGPKKDREVPVTVYCHKPGEEKKVHRRLVLREQDGWGIQF